MLEEIRVKNLGVIEEACLPFNKGLNVITGETGAGKTMVLTALGLLLGRKGDVGMVRHGSNGLNVEGRWMLDGHDEIVELVENVGGDVEDGLLYVNRSVTPDGKSRAVVGGRGTPLTQMLPIGDTLVSIHGQSDQIRLKNPNVQREALDKYAGEALKTVLEKYSVKFDEWRRLSKTVDDVRNNMASRQREFEELKEAVEKIAPIAPERGEDVLLKETIERLMNVETIRSGVEAASYAMTNDDFETKDLLELVSAIAKSLQEVAEYDSKLSEMVEDANNLKIVAGDLSYKISSYLDSVDGDQLAELNQAQERLASLNSLARRYGGGDLDTVVEYFETAETRMVELDPENSDLETLEAELASIFAELEVLGDEAHNLRKSAGQRLAAAVNEELKGLAMGGSTFVVNVEKEGKYYSYGVDSIAFLISPHPNAEPRPLSKGASGGELSRIQLALELILADPEATPTFVFDEVDSGIGGATAIEVGKRLAQLASMSQVIVVTHLPQVAVYGDNHLRVLKSSDEDFVSTDVVQLTEDDRVGEIARMLSGLSDSDSGQAHAKEMLDNAEAFKVSLSV